MLFVLSAIFIAASVAVLPLSSGTRAEDSYVYTVVENVEGLKSGTEIVLAHYKDNVRFALTAPEEDGAIVVRSEIPKDADITKNMFWIYGESDWNGRKFTESIWRVRLLKEDIFLHNIVSPENLFIFNTMILKAVNCVLSMMDCLII